MDNNQLNDLAAKIAKVIANEAGVSDIALLRQSIERLNERLDRLESNGLKAKPFVSSIHPSHETFGIPETLGDQVFGTSNEKICTFEPHSRPCDNCSMCTSRGF